ncbi:dTDP-3-amino-3,6-dideoxy-alpha-D-glucopyranose N,N-dimethyltransferase [Peptococcaceae bacterium CEB3]|nr:dTDP-3-amino-3,6-dideoxy-alpha-D-glucopyranose N,N-dimethyltransferase [Peptococcaceae bacterium CEB3]
MKSYLDVVRARYGGREKALPPQNNIYAIINPIGFNGFKGIAYTLYRTCHLLLDNNVNITAAKILDLGCGSGSTTRLLAEFTGHPDNIKGVDLSAHRIELAKSFSPNIEYIQGDIVKDWNFSEKFDLITAFDVFMHLESEEVIQKTLQNIRDHLSPKGFFLWFDSYASDHFHGPHDAECWGFSSRQIRTLAGQAGFEAALEFTLHKNLLGRVHSLYLYGRLPDGLIKTLEKILPGKPGNMVKIFRKHM